MIWKFTAVCYKFNQVKVFFFNLYQVRLDISLEYVGLPVTPEPSEGILLQSYL